MLELTKRGVRNISEVMKSGVKIISEVTKRYVNNVAEVAKRESENIMIQYGSAIIKEACRPRAAASLKFS
jgi:predicted RNA-binding protein with RPS1 domain